MAHSKRGRRKKPFKLKLKKESLYTIASIFLISSGGLIILSFSQQGKLLKYIYFWGTKYFGLGILFLPFLFISAGLMLTKLCWKICRPHVFIGSFLLFLPFIGLFQTGQFGKIVFQNIAVLITNLGAFLILAGAGFIGFVVLFETSFEDIFIFLSKAFQPLKSFIPAFLRFFHKKQPDIIKKPLSIDLKEEIKEEKESPKEIESEIITPFSQNMKSIWKYPPLSLLSKKIGGKADRGDIDKNKEIIEQTLKSFGVQAHVEETNYGPAVTQYALKIVPGTRLSKVTTLSNNLALALAAPTGQIRIEAPIPGRSLIGIEVPNRSLEFVPLIKMLSSEEMKKAKHKLTIALGLDVSGKPIIADLARMPHVLIAGATNSGKTCCLHSFIATILFRTTPDEVKFILVDPKRVELLSYNDIPHLLTPVITKPKKVISALKWAIGEMERRYGLFVHVGARNIDSYNKISGFQALPYIVIVIDELADIILFAPNEVEDTITRIAQMARATGIHLVISTQRPSVDVLTGLIKANIPCRIAFNVTSAVDSRVILDMSGAEKLLGRGDMLFIPPDQAKPTRIQGTFVSEPEIQKLTNFLKNTGSPPKYTVDIIDKYKSTMTDNASNEEVDELFNEAIKVVCRYDRASASLLQRRLSIGYARAARILDQLQNAGIVGLPEGSKPRKVLIKTPEEFLGRKMADNNQ